MLTARLYLRNGQVIEFRCERLKVHIHPLRKELETSGATGEVPLYVDMAEVAAVTAQRGDEQEEAIQS